MTLTRRIIGLTGGIGTGKSTVAQYLADNYQFPVLDADIYAREAVALDSPILKMLFQRYGSKIKQENGELNRQALGDIIFQDPLEKKWLEEQIHPFVRKRFEQELNQDQGSIIILVIPLLFEAEMTDLVTEIWLVICPLAEQIRRIKIRNNLTEEQAITRINSQLPLEQKIVMADVIIENNSTLEALFQQIDQQFSSITAIGD